MKGELRRNQQDLREKPQTRMVYMRLYFKCLPTGKAAEMVHFFTLPHVLKTL